jgi:hypothetical protein
MVQLLIAAIKLLVLIAGSVLEFARAAADIRAMVKKMFSESKDHVHKAVVRGRAHFKKKMRKSDGRKPETH